MAAPTGEVEAVPVLPVAVEREVAAAGQRVRLLAHMQVPLQEPLQVRRESDCGDAAATVSHGSSGTGLPVHRPRQSGRRKS